MMKKTTYITRVLAYSITINNSSFMHRTITKTVFAMSKKTMEHLLKGKGSLFLIF